MLFSSPKVGANSVLSPKSTPSVAYGASNKDYQATRSGVREYSESPVERGLLGQAEYVPSLASLFLAWLYRATTPPVGLLGIPVATVASSCGGWISGGRQRVSNALVGATATTSKMRLWNPDSGHLLIFSICLAYMYTLTFYGLPASARLAQSS